LFLEVFELYHGGLCYKGLMFPILHKCSAVLNQMSYWASLQHQKSHMELVMWWKYQNVQVYKSFIMENGTMDFW